MVNVELTDVDWVEPALFTVVFLVDCVRVDKFVVCFLVDSFALVAPTKGGSLRVSKFDSSRSTDRAYTCTGCFVNLRETVIHTCQVHKELVPKRHRKSR